MSGLRPTTKQRRKWWSDAVREAALPHVLKAHTPHLHHWCVCVCMCVYVRPIFEGRNTMSDTVRVFVFLKRTI